MEILITGDFSPHERVKRLIETDQTDDILKSFSNIIAKCDLNVTNLETAIILPEHKPSKKVGINIGSYSTFLTFLKNNGFNLLTLANNHFMDYGEESASYAISKIKEERIASIGAGRTDREATRPYIFEKNGVKVGIVNACEHEFIGNKDSFHCNEIDLITLITQLEKLKKEVDHIILIFHGGDEHSDIPRPSMVRLYRFLIDHGASAIINHHQHCINGYEEYNGGLIFYGLGNFCFDRSSKRNSPWNYGYAVKLYIQKNSLEYKIIPYKQCNEVPTVSILTGIESEAFEKKIKFYNEMILNENSLKSEYQKWLISNQYRYISYLSPYSNKYLRFLVRKKLLPSFIKNSHLRILYLMNSCESHRKAVQNILEKRK